MSNVLVIAEQDQGRLKAATLSAISLAQRASAGGTFDILVIGENISSAAEQLRNYGASIVCVAEHPALRNPLADKYAHVVAETCNRRKSTLLVGAASTFSKDVLPRAAALLDAGMVSDVIEVREDGGDFVFRRVLFAGNAIATVMLNGPIKVITCRAAAFPAPEKVPAASPLAAIAVSTEKLPAHAQFEARDEKIGGRPDSTEAPVVVSGGRAIKTPHDFEQLIGGLADALGGAIGCSRALVDAGITPNSLQVGQTGKIVAPDLYVAVGISGAIQHLAGMKDTKVIVAINNDPDAPIFEVADFAFVGDAYAIVPELTSKLRNGNS